MSNLSNLSNVRTLPATSQTQPVPIPVPVPAHPRLRPVAPGEVPPVAELLSDDATWYPAPQHSLPALPGQPPMVGYLVLVPATTAAPPQEVPRNAPEKPEEPEADEPAGAALGDGVVRIDRERRTALVRGRPLELTYLEFELLTHLVAHPRRVHSRDQLVTTVWGYGFVGDGRTVDVHIARLRRKLGPELRSAIVTVRRVGYKYEPAG